MAEQIRPGNLCSDIYRAYTTIVDRNGLPARQVGRAGHGIRNTGGCRYIQIAICRLNRG